ncbi:ABC transporter substrate-binding protein [Streptosporangium sp. NPDC051022]|uniref:ABC transporter substrate-binding protein n=1 Tax=Streptosporangium sp. NPDC051022 TaxID=3155752 RepID=UPI003430238C
MNIRRFGGTRHALIASAVTALAVGLAACGGGGGGGGGGTSDGSGTPELSAPELSASGKLLPEALKKSRAWTVGVLPDYPPQSFTDLSTNKLVGVNVDLADALAGELGLKSTYAPTKFDAMLAGLDAGRYQMSAMGFYVAPAREETADLIGYTKVRQSILVGKDYNGAKLNSYDDMCGLTVALVAGTPHEPALKKRSAECVGEGKDAITVQVFPGDTAMFAAVTSGRADATVTSTATSNYMVANSKEGVKRAGDSFQCTIGAFGIKKGQPELLAALKSAMEQLISSGRYKQVMDKWGLGELALDRAMVSPISGTFSTDDCGAV